MIRTPAVFPLCLLLCVSWAHGQQTAAGLTPDELITIAEQAIRLPDRCAWRLDVQSEVADPNRPSVASIVSTRTGKIQRDIINWKNSAPTEAWTVDGNYLAEDPHAEGMLFDPAQKETSRRLALASWISRENLQGLTNVGGRESILFKGVLKAMVFWPGRLLREPSDRLEVAATISVQNQTLLGLQIGKTVYRFTWSEPPTSSLELPAKFAQQYQHIRKVHDSLYGVPAVP